MITVAQLHDRLNCAVPSIIERLIELGFKNITVVYDDNGLRIEIDYPQEMWDIAVAKDEQILGHSAWESCPHCSQKYNKMFSDLARESYNHGTDL
jgi:hypothetical protein